MNHLVVIALVIALIVSASLYGMTVTSICMFTFVVSLVISATLNAWWS
jgi:hypothetical protein